MQIITTTEELSNFCSKASAAPYLTVDTEFLRERTYYAQLCLVQLAYPGDGETDATLVDPLAQGLSLAPLYDLFRDPSVVKVFHAARQDLEIFFVEGDVLPTPMFDTQVAAMVCGYGDQVGYETLVRRIAKAKLDKSSRFTDWSRRPLSNAQLTYALADVTHLRQIYESLSAELETSGRAAWVEEELASLLSAETYNTDPDEAWRRVKTRTTSGKFLALVRALASFRETYAQTKNVPRNRVFKDDVLVELASLKPSNLQELGRSRLLLREARKGEIAAGILTAVAEGVKTPPDAYPKAPSAKDKSRSDPALSDLLRVLLKAKSEQYGVAARLIASAADLDALSGGERDLPALQGWRAKAFGKDALLLCDGKLALTADDGQVRFIHL